MVGIEGFSGNLTGTWIVLTYIRIEIESAFVLH